MSKKGRTWSDEEKAEAKRKYWERVEAKAAEAANSVASAPLEQLDIEEEVAKLDSNPPVTEPSEPQTTVADDSETSQSEILKRAIEAITLLTQMQANNGGNAAQGPQIKNGQLTGTMDRFSVKSSDYIDFTGRLAQEPQLRRFGFKENFELTYKYEIVRYQTIDKIWMQEPKITIDLNRVIYDEDTGELTNGRYKQYRIVIHEDPNTAVLVARANGLDVPEDPESEKAFLNEMRYLQVRDWLFECFMPKKPQNNSNRRDMVINGKLVEYFETNSENTAKLPFDQLNTKL